MLNSNYYREIEPLLLQYFAYNQDAVNLWLFCPNYQWGRFTPVSLILNGDERPLKWIKRQLELRQKK